MSYETYNHLPENITLLDAVRFAKLLGFKNLETKLGPDSSKVYSLCYFDNQDFKSWKTIQMHIYKHNNHAVVSTRTSIGRSAHDFAFQNHTLRHFKKNFGGRAVRDAGDGAGYDPGSAMPPAASGCKLAFERLDWNLTRLHAYLNATSDIPQPDNFISLEGLIPILKEVNPNIFLQTSSFHTYLA